MVGAREALIVGIGVYEDPRLRRLRSPRQDARALARVLGNPEIGDFTVRDPVIDRPAHEVR
jgi:chaperonin GroEL